MNTSELAWFKSSYSNAEGEACVEVAYAWFKSSYSGNEGGACLEIARAPHAIHIRDSKTAEHATLTLTPTTWTAFLRAVR